MNHRLDDVPDVTAFDPSANLTTEELERVRTMAREHGVDYGVLYDPVEQRRYVRQRGSLEYQELITMPGVTLLMVAFANPRGRSEMEGVHA